MVEKKDKKEKPEEAILFSEVKVGNIVVKPWTFGKLFELAEILDNAITKVEAAGIDIEKIFSGDTIPYTFIAKLFSMISDEVLKVIKISVDMEEKEIADLDMATGIKLAFTIFNQNKEVIKNAFTSLRE